MINSYSYEVWFPFRPMFLVLFFILLQHSNNGWTYYIYESMLHLLKALHCSLEAMLWLYFDFQKSYAFLMWISNYQYPQFILIKIVVAGLLSGLFLPAVVRPILDSLETSKPVPPPQLSDVSDFPYYAPFYFQVEGKYFVSFSWICLLFLLTSCVLIH